PERNKLLAVQHDLKAMAKIIGVESLAFISHKGLEHAIQNSCKDSKYTTYCDACFTGHYPISLIDYNNIHKENQHG
ncbi:MAG: amidophosphoribosyltransferase, partial [Acetobacter sp.]|nr:amidophosphoribosyltransferase [Acetobacter sp.]